MMKRQQHDPNAAPRRIKRYIKKLNNRLNEHGIIVRFERETRHIVICRPASRQGDCSVYLSEVRYKKLMQLKNADLAAYFKAWHRDKTIHQLPKNLSTTRKAS